MKNQKRKNKPGAGRPAENREKMMVYVLPDTAKKINSAMTKELNTKGKVIDEWAKSASPNERV